MQITNYEVKGIRTDLFLPEDVTSGSPDSLVSGLRAVADYLEDHSLDDTDIEDVVIRWSTIDAPKDTHYAEILLMLNED